MYFLIINFRCFYNFLKPPCHSILPNYPSNIIDNYHHYRYKPYNIFHNIYFHILISNPLLRLYHS